MGIGFWISFVATLTGGLIDCLAWNMVAARFLGFALVLSGLTGMSIEAIEQVREEKKNECELKLKLEINKLKQSQLSTALALSSRPMVPFADIKRIEDVQLRVLSFDIQEAIEGIPYNKCSCEEDFFGSMKCEIQDEREF